MSDDLSFRSLSMADLVERSTFGSPDAVELRRRTPAAAKRLLLAALTCQDTGQSRHPAGPYFFMSVPQGGEARRSDAVAVHRFFRLVCSFLGQTSPDVAVDETMAPGTRAPGFLAGQPGVGTGSGARQDEALASCRVFVPLLSAGYFDDADCHSQWETFRRRDDERRARHPFGFSAIVPVLWDRPAELCLPLGAADMQAADTALGRDYAERGMRELVLDNGPTCRKVAFRLSRQIHDVAECLPLPGPGEPPVIDLKEPPT